MKGQMVNIYECKCNECGEIKYISFLCDKNPIIAFCFKCDGLKEFKKVKDV